MKTEDEMLMISSDSIDVGLSRLHEFMMDREAWYATIHGSRNSWTGWSDLMELTIPT